MGRIKQSLSEQLDTCRRRLHGHNLKVDKNGKDTDVPRNKNANYQRFLRLLQREAQLSYEISLARRSSFRK